MPPQRASSCWGCRYHKLGGVNITGYCPQFKPIPANVVDKGCDYGLEKISVPGPGGLLPEQANLAAEDGDAGEL
jgi:hypothetical protein